MQKITTTLLFIFLLLACGGKQSKKSNEMQADSSAFEMIQENIEEDATIDCLYINQQISNAGESYYRTLFIPRFAIIDLTGTRVIYKTDEYYSMDESMAKRYTHCIYEGKVFPIKFEKRQEASPDWKHRDFNHYFDDMPGLVFSVTEGCLFSPEELAKDRVGMIFCDALLVDENYLNGLEILPIIKKYTDNSIEYDDETALPSITKYDAAPANIAEYYKTQFDIDVVGTVTLGKTEKIVLYKVIYSVLSHGDSGYSLLVGALAIADGDRVIGSDNDQVESFCISSVMKKNEKYQIIRWEADINGSESCLFEESENKLIRSFAIQKSKATHPFW